MKRANWIAGWIGAALIVVAGGSFFAQQSKTPSLKDEVALRAAREKENVQGDLKGAIKEYEKLVNAKDRALAAQALLRIAECHTKLGDADARKAYERLVRDFPEQTAAVSEARAQLASLEHKPALTASVALYTTNIDLNTGKLTSTPKLIPNQPPGLSDDPAWSPDGKQLVYVTRGQGILSIVSWATGQRREIHDYGKRPVLPSARKMS
jgi:hypothetical protein